MALQKLDEKTNKRIAALLIDMREQWDVFRARWLADGHITPYEYNLLSIIGGPYITYDDDEKDVIMALDTVSAYLSVEEYTHEIGELCVEFQDAMSERYDSYVEVYR